ncbi:MAG: hypothetical protein N2Z85_02510 [Patescibacteria group bacterium]|nr:hypothetical protein [Patescibacteria group bacterium]
MKLIIIFYFILFLIPCEFMFSQTKNFIERNVKNSEIVGLGFEKKKVANAEIKDITINYNSSEEKNQNLKLPANKIITNEFGEFEIELPFDIFKKLKPSSTFTIKLRIIPPKEFYGLYESDQVEIKLKQKDGAKYFLILEWIPESTKTNKGTFAVSSKAQT